MIFKYVEAFLTCFATTIVHPRLTTNAAPTGSQLAKYATKHALDATQPVLDFTKAAKGL